MTAPARTLSAGAVVGKDVDLKGEPLAGKANGRLVGDSVGLAKGNAVGARGFETMKKAWDLGLMVRANGDTLAFSPPLIINENQVDEMFTKVKKALEQVD